MELKDGERNLQTNATTKGIGDFFFMFIVINVFQCRVLHFLKAEIESLEWNLRVVHEERCSMFNI